MKKKDETSSKDITTKTKILKASCVFVKLNSKDGIPEIGDIDLIELYDMM